MAFTVPTRSSRVLPRAISTALTLAVAVCALTGLTGCKNNNAAMEQLTLENQELRDRRDQLVSALDECDSKYNALVEEREGLIDENNQLRSDLASAATRPASPNIGALPAGVDASFRDSELVLNVAGDVLFASGKVTLRDDAKRTLNQLADLIKRQYPSNLIRIAGHTDSDPIRKSQWKTNERLSAERALAVEDYLSTRGIPKDSMYIAGFGSADPRSSKAESRRVEIIILNAR